MPLLRLAQLSSLVSILASFLIAPNAGATSISAQHNYKQIQTFLRTLVKQNPGRVELMSIGVGGTGEAIEGVKVGSGPLKNLIVGTHHGNEYGSTEVALAVAADLAKAPVAGQTVYVIPVLNISGFNAGRREENVNGSSGATTDGNRDYPGPCGTEGPFRLKSTKALADFVDREGIVTLATLHTSFPAVAYPWGFSTPDLSTSYESQFMDLGRVAAELSGYKVGNSAEVIYPADGTFEDYVFWKHGVWSLLFELGYTHSPDEDELAELDRVNVPGIRHMLEHSPLARGTDHEFRGKCDTRLRSLDLHNE